MAGDGLYLFVSAFSVRLLYQLWGEDHVALGTALLIDLLFRFEPCHEALWVEDVLARIQSPDYLSFTERVHANDTLCRAVEVLQGVKLDLRDDLTILYDKFLLLFFLLRHFGLPLQDSLANYLGPQSCRVVN